MVAPAPQPMWQMPRLDPSDRWIGGTASAIAREVGVQPLVIRMSFVALALVAGWGLLLYAICWAALGFFAQSKSPYSPRPKAATATHRHIAVAMIVIGLMLLFGLAAPEVIRRLTLPLGFILAGGLIAWTRVDETRGITVLVRLIAGVTVAVGGIVALTTTATLSIVNIVTALTVGIAVVAGITIIAAPSVVQMGRALDDERLDRIRIDERARISAHLHDSVLQTLTLIQRNADDPVQTAALARQQERELRAWLYGPKAAGPDSVHLGQAIERAAGDVEAMHGVKIEVVSIGETGEAIDRDVSMLIAAVGEAMANAAVHSGAKTIDVFIERLPDAIEVFVRDTGSGFDLANVGADRRGLSESIIGRMERAGGHAHIHSEPGAGTEIELRLPLSITQESPT